VREYLRYSAGLRGLEGPQIAAAVQRMLEDWMLGDTADRLIRSLSHGYRQRVGLAQAQIHRPAVLLLDEPTEGLDPQQVSRFRQLMAGQAAKGAVLLSTHRLDFIAGLCTRLMVLHDGRVVREQPLSGESATQLHALFDGAVGAEAA
jgi:ABC-2 type transport system ATP-binding protein